MAEPLSKLAEKCKSCPKSEKCDHKKMELCALADLPQQNLASATQGILIDNMSPALREEIKSPLSPFRYKDELEKGLAGYCEEENKLIVVADMSEEKYFVGMDEKAQETYRKKTLRHEIMHAFLNESGLSDSSNQFDGAWAKSEEMVDWFAIQAPKIFSTFKKMNIL